MRLYSDPTTAAAMRLFAYSITYVTLLFAAMALDQLVAASLNFVWSHPRCVESHRSTATSRNLTSRNPTIVPLTSGGLRHP